MTTLLVFLSSNGQICEFDADKVNSCMRDSIDLSPLVVQKALSKIKGHASSGSDD